ALAFSSAATCASVRINPSCATLASKALRRFWNVSRSCRSQTPRTPEGETINACRLSSLATLTCPNAGCSNANSSTACSISLETRFAGIGFLRLIRHEDGVKEWMAFFDDLEGRLLALASKVTRTASEPDADGQSVATSDRTDGV